MTKCNPGREIHLDLVQDFCFTTFGVVWSTPGNCIVNSLREIDEKPVELRSKFSNPQGTNMPNVEGCKAKTA